MNHLNENKLANGAVGAILATAVTAFFAVGIASGIVAPHLVTLDPVALSWGYLNAPAAVRPQA